MAPPEALLVVGSPKEAAVEGDDPPVPPQMDPTKDSQGNCMANPLKLSGNVLLVRIGCITVNAVLDTGPV